MSAPSFYQSILCQRLAERRLSICMSVRMVSSVEIALLARGAGFDALYVDMEHGSLSPHAASQICVTALAVGVTPLVRLAGQDGEEGARYLERGAQGLIVPHVSSGREIARFVEACSFPPKGSRSLGGAGAHFGFQATGPGAMMETLARNTTIIAMLEDRASVERADEIAAVDGVDVVMIGSNDFLADIGEPGNHASEVLANAYSTVATACDRHGKTLGVAGIKRDPALLRTLIKLGAGFITGGSDSAVLFHGLSQQAESIRDS